MLRSVLADTRCAFLGQDHAMSQGFCPGDAGAALSSHRCLVFTAVNLGINLHRPEVFQSQQLLEQSAE